MKAISFKKKSNFIGIGLIFNRDEAGDSKYGTVQAGLSASWVKALNRSNKNLISVGGQISYNQRSIDYGKLYFPNQWNGQSSAGNLAHHENFTVNQFSFIDISTGVHWFWAASSKIKFNTGLSAWHLSRPNQNLMQDQESRLDIKYQVYSECEITIDRPFSIIPSALYASQGPYQELILGVRLHYKIHQERQRLLAISAGIYGRNKDALILYLGLDYKTLKFAATYDINLSSLSVASNYMGGMELNVQWLIFKGQKIRKISPTPCPIF